MVVSYNRVDAYNRVVSFKRMVSYKKVDSYQRVVSYKRGFSSHVSLYIIYWQGYRYINNLKQNGIIIKGKYNTRGSQEPVSFTW